MKSRTIIAAMCLLAGCTATDHKLTIDRNEPVIADSLLTTEVLWQMGRMSGAHVSPDGRRVLYTVNYPSVEQNKSNAEIYVINADGTGNRRLTRTDQSEHSACWADNGSIAYMLQTDDGMQVFRMDTTGRNVRQVTRIEGGISGFRYSPDGSMLLYVKNVKRTPSMLGSDKYADLPLATGRVITDLNYRHWDQWVDEIPHPFLARIEGGDLADTVDLLEGEMYESPMLPWGGMEELDFTPDSRSVAYTCRKKSGKDYVVSTNSDIYLYDIESKTTRNLTEGMMGYDVDPRISPDGQWMAWASMERDGYESDKNRLFVMNLQTGERRDLTAGVDQSVNSYTWAADSRSLWITSVWHGKTQVYSTDIDQDTLRCVTAGTHDYAWVAPTADGLVGMRHSMSEPNDLYRIDPQTGVQTQITFENKHILDQLAKARVEERWLPTTDGKQMLTWVIYPPHFDPQKKYPAILYTQGGPQQPVSQFWSWYWNFQLFASQGYIIVAPNRRGLYGFGQEWLEQISGDYGGQNMRDYLTAIDAVAAEPYVDETRLGCMGASYGGFSAYWLAGHHEGRFKAIIAHDGIYNLEQQYVETEEMWFVNWDLGGAPWDKQNPTAQRSYENSPHRFVDQWDTPILCIHGELDYRIVASQGMSAFNAATLRGIPAEYLYFPDENHWVLQPQNCILWEREMIGWMDRWLKVDGE